MSKFILIRHGKPDYSLIKNKNFKGHGCDLAPLSNEGIEQAKIVAHNELLNGADILISSPYTRCMHTSSIISNITNLPIIVDVDLHEWLPDLTFNYNTNNLVRYNYKQAIQDYVNGLITSNNYESIMSVQIRVLNVLKKYLEYEKVIVVTHGGVMYSLTDNHYPYCGIDSIEYDGKVLVKK